MYSDEPTSDEGVRLGLGADIPSHDEKERLTGPQSLRRLPLPTAGESGKKPLAVSRYHTLIASYIFADLAPEWEKQFSEKNATYGEYDYDLKELGEFVEIHRKYKMLRRAYLEKADTSGWKEQPREIAMDMIGHLYLLIAVIDELDNDR
jgi:hypothetical protein